ncbi:Dehydrogenase/reductase SDR family member 7C-B [Larimichthys crocea]|uniref:Dehydrogenase/reductase SDR family member 7C-B n=2 Tax=Larimichthys crocea TaxID=215358 RepID=A0A6G0HUL7_LARCR|nr:Dehydrogenase/reductase SDR family member 7C-B [Larimichthys crocea]
MDPVWTTTVLLVPLVVVLTAGVFFLYSAVIGLLSKTSVRNKTFPPKLVLLDFGDMDSMPEVIEEILECYGCLDILILNSSMKFKAPVQNVSLEMDKLLMDNNYFGPATLAKGVLPSMISRRTGHLLLINSIQGKLAVPFRATYAASKHAVQAFFDSLRAEVEEYGISVSTINHTFISPSSSESTEAASSKSIWSLLYTKKPLGVSPDEAATEIVKTLSNKRKEVVIAPSLPKVAIYARSFFPNVFFAVMAAGVNNAAASEKM